MKTKKEAGLNKESGLLYDAKKNPLKVGQTIPILTPVTVPEPKDKPRRRARKASK